MKTIKNVFFAIIPARSGSKGVPNKNIRLLCGHPLLAWSIAAGKLCVGIDRVIVSTDSEEYANIARQYGAEVPFLRPQDISHDTSSDRDFFYHAANWFEKYEGRCPEHFIHLRPTTPLRKPQLMAEAIQLYLSEDGKYSLRSAHESSESPAKWFSLHGKMFSGFIGNEAINHPRQLLPKVYIPNGYIDIVSIQEVLEKKDIYIPELLAFITPVAYEVDTLEEWNYLTYMAKDHLLLSYLDKLKKQERL